MFYYAPKMLYYAGICYYAFKVYYAQNYASRIRQGLISIHTKRVWLRLLYSLNPLIIYHYSLLNNNIVQPVGTLV